MIITLNLNPEVKISSETLCLSNKEKKQYLVGERHKDSRVKDVIKECIYHFCLHIFWYDVLGQSLYI